MTLVKRVVVLLGAGVVALQSPGGSVRRRCVLRRADVVRPSEVMRSSEVLRLSSEAATAVEPSPYLTVKEEPLVLATVPPLEAAQEKAPVEEKGSWLARNPLAVKCLSFGVTYAAADMTAQIFACVTLGEVVPLLERCRRVLSLAAVGTFAVGPLLAYWFDFLEWLVPGKKAKAVATRTFLDQLIQVPFCIAMIFTLSSMAEGHGLLYCYHKIQMKLLSTWRDCVLVWCPVQFINQGLIPLQYRVLFQAIISFFWDTYLSIISHSVKVI